MIDAMAWEVLNATADDWESLEQLQDTVVRFLAPVSRAVVTRVAERLVADGLFEARSADATSGETWFRMTSAGRAAWEQATQWYAR